MAQKKTKKSHSSAAETMKNSPLVVGLRIAFAVVFVMCIVTFFVHLFKIVAIRKEIQNINMQIENAQEEGEALSEQIDRADTPEAIEDAARQNGMGYPDETVFIDSNSTNTESTGD